MKIAVGSCNHEISFENKKVTFNENVVVKTMTVWQFAHRQARKADWEVIALDGFRFRERIKRAEETISPIIVKRYK
jgi:hypothetical protein